MTSATPGPPSTTLPGRPHCGHGATAEDPVGCRGRRIPDRTACPAHVAEAGRAACPGVLAPGTGPDRRATFSMLPNAHEAARRPARIRRRRAACPVTLALISTLLLASCATERQEHASDAGPLSANVETGATSVFAPGDHPWTETFGSYLLCSTTGAQIELEDIRYETPVKPLKVELQLRSAPPGFDLGPITSASGQPPKFKGIGDISGQVEPFRKGVKISQKCDQDAAAHGFTELLFVVKTGKAGGHISKTWIDYTAGGDPFTLVINWQMITCGKDVGPVNGVDRCDSEGS